MKQHMNLLPLSVTLNPVIKTAIQIHESRK